VNVHQLDAYDGSKDYERLAELAKKHSIICILDYQEHRDVAKTIYSFQEGRDETWWKVSARDISYITADNHEGFIASCKRLNLAFIEPSQ